MIEDPILEERCDIAADRRLLRFAPTDSVAVVRRALLAGDVVEVEGVAVTIPRRLGLGYKLACAPVAEGGRIVKYGAPIGRATEDIRGGAHLSEEMDVNAGRILDGEIGPDEVAGEIQDAVLGLAACEKSGSEDIGHNGFILTCKSFEHPGPDLAVRGRSGGRASAKGEVSI